ncbi:hypothetical protein J6500_12170 [Bradyrhizobium sp. WSM 1704]|uniref:right-handed parallel beta-helix repeat-containing protein n=1 Tax=Bradyrhizobium semiaridum TaxID=2821404 RepID=UPI001CE393BA|nr:right-handed parallel beta-helix repeat-containing protein [Bradyrhizobium semiaridum]MCA6122643.1 hypothetical protein [Bradyrhizobium semiaridum]
MKCLPTSIAILLTAAVLTVRGIPEAKAQNFNSYVSAQGNDANSCENASLTCRSFQRAVAATADGGVVTCIDAAYFYPFTIDRSITIDCMGRGQETGRILINAPAKKIILRNIGINAGSFYIPIIIQAAAEVYIENAIIAESYNAGIDDHRAGPAKLVVRNSSIVRNSGAGIVIAPSSGIIGVELDNVNSAYNKYGLAVGNGGRVMIKNSTFTGNSAAGITTDATAIVGVTATELSFNGIGIVASGTVTLSNSSINSNSTAISGPTRSLGNNLIFANPAEGTTPTIVSAR